MNVFDPHPSKLSLDHKCSVVFEHINPRLPEAAGCSGDLPGGEFDRELREIVAHVPKPVVSFPAAHMGSLPTSRYNGRTVKLAVCIVHSRDKGKVTEELVRAGFKFTVIGSTGGFLREGNTTFIIGIEDDEVDALYSVVEQNCQTREQVVNVMPFETGPQGGFMASPVKVPVGGAVVFLMPVEQFRRF